METTHRGGNRLSDVPHPTPPPPPARDQGQKILIHSEFTNRCIFFDLALSNCVSNTVGNHVALYLFLPATWSRIHIRVLAIELQ